VQRADLARSGDCHPGAFQTFTILTPFLSPFPSRSVFHSDSGLPIPTPFRLYSDLNMEVPTRCANRQSSKCGGVRLFVYLRSPENLSEVCRISARRLRMYWGFCFDLGRAVNKEMPPAGKSGGHQVDQPRPVGTSKEVSPCQKSLTLSSTTIRGPRQKRGSRGD
jgi:hypothetical protein